MTDRERELRECAKDGCASCAAELRREFGIDARPMRPVASEEEPMDGVMAAVSTAAGRKPKAAAAARDAVWDVIETVLPHTRRALLSGPPGTGKTYAALFSGREKAQTPCYAVTMTEEMSAAEVRGHYVPAGGEFRWQDGPAIRAWRTGGRLVVNEIQRTSGDNVALLLAILDDQESAVLTLPTGETVRPADGFQCVATMNGDPAADLDPALRDRFPVCVTVESVHPEALARLPEDLRAPAARAVLAEPERRLSVRVWLEFARLRQAISEDVAAAACFGVNAGDVLNALRTARA